MLFDDFDYRGPSDASLASHGWSVRTARGGPGIPGASWSAGAVTFVPDPAAGGNTLMQLTAATDGTAAGTVQAEVTTTAQKFLAGTYAARVRLTDAPASGPDGDQVNQTFFTITPLRYDNDPLYSELDFEYLPNGGWGSDGATMFTTSYYTYANNPSWSADNDSSGTRGSLQGWHVLAMQVSGGTVTYTIDGRVVHTTTGRYYPRQPMLLSFNNWFIDGGLVGGGTQRGYPEQVDWVYYGAGANLTAAQVQARVDAYRTAGVTHTDTVPAGG